MSRIAKGLLDFVVGDDVLVALGVAVLLAATAVGARLGADPWWLTAAALPVLVWRSCVRARRSTLGS